MAFLKSTARAGGGGRFGRDSVWTHIHELPDLRSAVSCYSWRVTREPRRLGGGFWVLRDSARAAQIRASAFPLFCLRQAGSGNCPSGIAPRIFGGILVLRHMPENNMSILAMGKSVTVMRSRAAKAMLWLTASLFLLASGWSLNIATYNWFAADFHNEYSRAFASRGNVFFFVALAFFAGLIAVVVIALRSFKRRQDEPAVSNEAKGEVSAHPYTD
jgi:hypothetical protein